MSIEHDKRSEVDRPQGVAVMFLIIKENKILLEDRVEKGKSYFGLHIIPGGKFDPTLDKTTDDTTVRESKEEYGIDVTKMVLLDSFEDVTPHNNHYLVHAYLIEEYNGEIQNMEPHKHKPVWVDLEKAKEIMPYGNSRYALLLAKLYLSR